MRNNETVMGIDVGSATVKTIIAEKREGEALPYVLSAVSSPSHGLRKGCVINQRDVAIAIKNSVRKAQQAANTNIRQAFISISGAGLESIRSKGSIAVSRADHEITENDLKRALSQSEAQLTRISSSYLLNREIIHSFPIFYKIDDESVIGSPLGMKGEKLEIETLFITSPSQYLNNLLKSLEIAGITTEDIFADSWAVSHALLKQKEKEVGCIVINIGGDTSSIITFEESSPISLEVLPIGSNHITYDIARGFQILLDEAELLKISYGSDITTKKKLSNIIEPRLNDIFELVENHLGKIKRSKLLPAGIFLTGGGANLYGIDEVARKTLQLPVQSKSPNYPGMPSSQNNDPTWSVALGLCHAALDKNNGLSLPKGIFSKTQKTVLKVFKHLLP